MPAEAEPAIEGAARGMAEVRSRGGRLFVLGVGGSAAHAAHAACDFRKLCGFEAYCPSDNVAELTARINDDGWDSCYAEWLKASRLSAKDSLLVLSVGGGSAERNISVNLVEAVKLARSRGAAVFGIVGRDGGFTSRSSDCCILIPSVNPERVTPLAEGVCSVICHLLATHPLLAESAGKWERTGGAGV